MNRGLISLICQTPRRLIEKLMLNILVAMGIKGNEWTAFTHS